MPKSTSKSSRPSRSRRPTTNRKNYGAMKIVKEARASSPLTLDDQELLIKRFNQWSKNNPNDEVDVNELVQALQGNTYELGGVKYRSVIDTELTGVIANSDDSNDEEVITEEESEDYGEDPIPLDETEVDVYNPPLDEDDHVITTTDWVEDDESIEHDSESRDDTIGDEDNNTSESGALSSISGFFTGLGDRVRNSWRDYTADVRVPVNEEPESVDNEKKSINDSSKTSHSVSDDSATDSNDNDGDVSRPSLLDRWFGSNNEMVIDEEQDSTSTSPDEPITVGVSLNPFKAIRRVGSVVNSFIDGLAGRPVRFTRVTNNENDASHNCKYRKRLRLMNGLLMVIGGLAVIRVITDLIRPRR